MESAFVVLGAAGGIGSALVRRLTAAGHHVLAAVLATNLGTAFATVQAAARVM